MTIAEKYGVRHVAADIAGAGPAATAPKKPSFLKKTEDVMQGLTDTLVKAKIPDLFNPGAVVRRLDKPKFGAKLPEAKLKLKPAFTSVLAGAVKGKIKDADPVGEGLGGPKF